MLANNHFVFFIPLIILSFFLEGKEINKILRSLIEVIPLLFFISSMILSIDVFYMLADLLVVIQIAKFILPKERIDYYEIFIVGFVIMILSSVQTISIAFAILLFAVFVLGALMLILANFKNFEIDLRTFLQKLIVLSFISFTLSFVIFFAIPRLSFGFLHGNSLLYANKSGFNDTVQISDSKVNLDATIIMRIETPLNASPIYITGLRYVKFNGKQWIKEPQLEKIYPNSDYMFGSKDGLKASTVYLEPTGTNVLFGIDRIKAIRGDFNYLFQDSQGDFFTDAVFYRTIKYDVFSDINDNQMTKLSNFERLSYLQLPPLSEDFKKLMNGITYGKSETEKIYGLLNYLNSHCTYSLEPDKTSIEDFVINGGKGYCEHFATAFVLMARASDIPARLVSGFVTSERNENGPYFLVRGRDAHTWAEIYSNSKWQRVDPTPPQATQPFNMISQLIDSVRMSWYRNIITYNLSTQFSLMSKIGNIFSYGELFVRRGFDFLKNNLKSFILLLLIISIAFFAIKNKKNNKKSLLSLILSLIGTDRFGSETLLEFYYRKTTEEEIFEIIQIYNKWRFGNGKADIKEIEKLISQYKVKTIT